MSQSHDITCHPNPDLETIQDNKPSWNLPATRRQGYRNLYRIPRYAIALRSDLVLDLTPEIDPEIAKRKDVRKLTSLAPFVAMVAVKNQTIIFEKYAPDFPQNHPHTLMSVSKMVTNLIYGSLVEDGLIDLTKTIDSFLPEIGSGYAKATVAEVLDMNIQNDFSEDYTDPFTSSFLQEVALGWRLPTGDDSGLSQQEFLCSIKAVDGSIANKTGAALYKSANTDVLGWIAERASGRSLRDWMLEIVEATGISGSWHMHTDRSGMPNASGGISLTARDLARFGQLFCRKGLGVAGRNVGSADFIDETRTNPGPRMPAPKDFFCYSNQTMTNGHWLGHGGYGGQFLLANPDTGVSVAYYSVLENRHAVDPDYQAEQIKMMAAIAADFG